MNFLLTAIVIFFAVALYRAERTKLSTVPAGNRHKRKTRRSPVSGIRITGKLGEVTVR